MNIFKFFILTVFIFNVELSVSSVFESEASFGSTDYIEATFGPQNDVAAYVSCKAEFNVPSLLNDEIIGKELELLRSYYQALIKQDIKKFYLSTVIMMEVSKGLKIV